LDDGVRVQRIGAWSALAIVVALGLGACGGSGGSTSIGAGLTGRSGLHAAVFARGIPQMSAFAYDSDGRLWVTRSGSTAHARDGVYLVARPGAMPVKVVSSIRGPLGLVWIGQRLYVSHLGGVDRFDGFDGRAFARRTTILRGPVAGAENNNLVLAPSGRLVMGVSATCDHCSTTPRFSGAVVSFLPDGSGLRVLAGGIRAAYGLLFHGDKLYASMNQRDDLGAKTPGDWLAIVEQGQDWRFPACYGQGGDACDGVPEPLAELDPHAAAGGVAIGGSTAYVAEWVDGKVMGVPVGGGKARAVLTGLSHPLPLLVSQDGSLLVGDWGSGVIYRVSGLSG
jgi:glucose/arabinose dehydrogenase